MNENANDIKAVANAVEAVADTSGKDIDASVKFGAFISLYINGSLKQGIGIVEDKFTYMRWERQIRLMQRANKFLEDQGIEKPERTISMKVAIPLFHAASLEENDYLQDKWARLLVNAATNSGINIERVYINILEQLSYLDVINLEQIYFLQPTNLDQRYIDTTELPKKAIWVSSASESEQTLSDEIELSLANLSRLGLINGLAIVSGGFKFETVTLKSNENYYRLNNSPLFKSIHISNDLKKLVVELKNGVTYEGCKNEIEAYINQLCFNIRTYSNVMLDSPGRTLEIINDTDKGEDENIIIIREHITYSEKIIIQVLTGAEDFYRDIITRQTATNKHSVLYERIFQTLCNPNKVVQFLSLYQFLYDLLGKEKPQAAQKYVTQYIKDRGSKYPHIGFKPSRKHGKDEDDLTYLRNEISHAEDTNDLELYSKLGIEITDSKIKQIIIILNDVLLELP